MAVGAGKASRQQCPEVIAPGQGGAAECPPGKVMEAEKQKGRRVA